MRLIITRPPLVAARRIRTRSTPRCLGRQLPDDHAARADDDFIARRKRAVLRHSLAVDMAARQAAKVFQENGTASCEQTGMLLCHPPGLHHQYALRGPSDTDGQRKPSILKTAV